MALSRHSVGTSPFRRGLSEITDPHPTLCFFPLPSACSFLQYHLPELTIPHSSVCLSVGFGVELCGENPTSHHNQEGHLRTVSELSGPYRPHLQMGIKITLALSGSYEGPVR